MAITPDGRFRGLVHGHRQPIVGMAMAPQAVLLAALLQLLPRVAAASSSSSSSSSSTPAVFPYTPTTILVPSANSSVVYLFSASESGQVEFLSLNISSTLSSSSIDGLTLLTTTGVPFLANSGQENTATTFTPTVRSDGSIFVYAGDCSSSSSSSATVWSYSPSSSTAQWTSSTLSLSSSQSGPWFLGSSTAFSNQIAPTMSNSTFYIYGGMCPTTESGSSTATSAAASATSITASNWQGSASYSNKMLKLVPSSNTYTPSIVSSKGPPIAEAGFTFTTLSSSQSNRSGIVTQQVNSVVLGGHTETAFVNMSTAAIWSLPEEAWSFVSIANPSSSSSGNTELAVVRKDSSSVSTAAPDSRSGHSAVLSEDGNSLVILGGWVGDVNQAADPQLAVLEMGPDYGQWQWFIPTTQPSGSGMYGHGAALLPGNVMVVYGGYNISSSTSSAKLIRRESSNGGNGLMFYNLTSQSWSEDYTNPTYDSSTAAPSSQKSSTSTTKIGLGVGLGLGIPLAILIVVLLVCSCRRNGRQRRRRDEAVRALAQDHQQFLHGHDEMVESSAGASLPFGWGNGREGTDFYTGGHDPYNSGRRSLGFETLRGAKSSPAFPNYQSPNLHGDEPSMPGPAFTSQRKPARNVARGLYQPTNINDYESFLALGNNGGAAAGNGTNGIHPIYEADEEDDDNGTEKGKQRGEVGSRSISPETEELTDPFLTPSTQSVNAGSVNPMRSAYAGAFGPNTVNLNPFVRNTPSPEAGAGPSRAIHSGMMGGADLGVIDPTGTTAGPLKVGQDRDVQEWVSGLEIEDLLFSPPAPGAGAAIAASVSPAPGTQPRGRVSPTHTNRRLSLRSKNSTGGSPTRGTFLGTAAAAAAGAVAGVAGAWGASDDEARTGSNLSDKSALSFLSRTTSSRGHAPPHSGAAGALKNKASSSDSSSASFNTAQSGFRSLRNEGPDLLYGKGHQNGSSAGGSFGASGASSSNNNNNNNNSGRGGASTPNAYTLNAPPTLPPLGFGRSHEYGGAAGVMAAGAVAGAGAGIGAAYHHRHASEDDENDTLTGSPSKLKGRKTWMGSFMRIFSSGSPANANIADASLDAANSSSMGTGAQQGPNYRDMAHATLLRRKQGRSDWEADELREEENTAVGALRSGGRSASISSMHGYSHNIGQGTGSGAGGQSASGNIAAGRRDGSGKSDEWDVEKAVQNRVVQVMFTMPRGEQLRVVNAEVEREDDEADIGNLGQSVVDPHDYSINTDLDHKDVIDENDDDAGGLSAPPPPPVLQRPYHSNRSRSPHATTDTTKTSTNEQYRALPIPPELASPIPPSIIDRQDEQLRQLHEALAESKRLLSTQAIEPWMLDAHDDDDDDDDDDYGDDAVTFGGEEVHENEAQAIPINKGKVVDVEWMQAGSMPSPLNMSSVSERRSQAAEERERLATAAALARVFMSRPGATPPSARKPVPAPAPAKEPAPAPAPSVLTMPTKPAAAAVPPALPTRARTPATVPTTPTKVLTPVRSLASTYKTPTKAVSNDSLSTNTSLTSRRSGRRGTLGGDTLLGSPAAAEAASTIKKPAGFVLNMVDKIELTGSPKSSHSQLD